MNMPETEWDKHFNYVNSDWELSDFIQKRLNHKLIYKT